jgi:hypothetical protein
MHRYLKYFFVLLLLHLHVVKSIAQNTPDSSYNTSTDTSVAPPIEEDSAYTTENDTALSRRFTARSFADTFITIHAPAKNVFDSLSKHDDDFWYANFSKKKEVAQVDDKPGFFDNQQNRDIVFMLLIGVFVGIIVWYLLKGSSGFFASRSKPVKQVADNNDEEKDIFLIDFEKQLQQALQAGNYRLATRLLFLRMLRSLTEKEIITYHIDKTNMDYLLELNNKRFSKDFSFAARNYEYVWYGKFDISADQYSAVKSFFDSVEDKIKFS